MKYKVKFPGLSKRLERYSENSSASHLFHVAFFTGMLPVPFLIYGRRCREVHL